MWLSSLKNHWEKLSPTEGLGGLLWIFTLPLSLVFWKGLVPLWFWAWLLFHLVLRESLPLYHFLSAWLTDGCMISCLYRMFKVSQTSHHFLNASALHFGLTFLSMWDGTRHSLGKVSEFCTAGSEVFSIQRLVATSLLVSCKVCPCLQLEQIPALLVHFLIWSGLWLTPKVVLYCVISIWKWRWTIKHFCLFVFGL